MRFEMNIKLQQQKQQQKEVANVSCNHQISKVKSYTICKKSETKKKIIKVGEKQKI